MGYSPDDTIDWRAVEYIDRWLDGTVAQIYKDQPLAQDWGRVAKVIEELGEVIAELIKFTGQNPRKPSEDAQAEFIALLTELADTAITAILAMQHFTKDRWVVRQIIINKIEAIEKRARENWESAA